ncbi:subtilisin-like protease SBT1.7 [Cocos nucifera]|uniref:Subtilisin-like protease SBT1.7 n=1 Tax=Cocos nucifera TaxID=13894 RepID=A0A8K0N8M3_COCNU|nr:subtilisin-like protease SBT1.7 [Cocos nucifera]
MSIITFLLFLLFTSRLTTSPVIGETQRPVPPLAGKAFDSTGEVLKTYIIHVHPNLEYTPSDDPDELEKWHKSFLPSNVPGSGESRLVYSYSNVINGFAARLTEGELAEMKKKVGFLHAHPDQLIPLQTTHTPDFLGLRRDSPGFWSDAKFGEGVIVGVLDTGILPTHPSFDDNEMPPPPARWKGFCEFGATECNNKLIGARTFTRGMYAMKGLEYADAALQAPYDGEGHGTHTAGTATGTFVEKASVAGQAAGTAAGMAPFAHLAVYKVCGAAGCPSSDILAGLDSAIKDGVDVVSLSLGGSSVPFYNDAVAIGTFSAMEKGIFPSCAAGNSGPTSGSLSNEAPWILTVGASTMDRAVRTTVELGNGATFDGESLYQPSDFLSTLVPLANTKLRSGDLASQLGEVQTASLPLVYPGLLGGTKAALCLSGSLNNIDVQGKVVVCDDGQISRVDKGMTIKKAGGAAMIVASTRAEGFTILDDIHVLPASHISYADGLKIKSYINSASAPMASITFKGTVIGTSPAPAVAYFSSRGPNMADRNILKPDIVGPGVNVLAAWPIEVGPPGAASMFNVISGTSMATPHLSGIAALLKRSHPDWSPAAIKSAIMTTADLTANDGSMIPDQNLDQASFFAVGAGHVNPLRADKPGLIYDINSDDYIAYLCGLTYTDRQVSAVVRRSVKCSSIRSISGSELNYASFMVILNARNGYKLEVTRTVKNVGAARSVYKAQITSPRGVSVAVKPTQLSFSKVNEEARFTVTFSSDGRSKGYMEGFLTWFSSDGSISVNSPLMVSVQ